jgi:hypothetical protein
MRPRSGPTKNLTKLKLLFGVNILLKLVFVSKISVLHYDDL